MLAEYLSPATQVLGIFMRALQLSRVPFASEVAAKTPRQMATSRAGIMFCDKAMPADTTLR